VIGTVTQATNWLATAPRRLRVLAVAGTFGQATHLFAAASLAWLTNACASEGTKVHEQGQLQHQKAAEEEEQAARRLAATGEQRQEAERHRALAAKHRAASEALRAAELHACGGLREQDIDQSPFLRGSEMVGVETLPIDLAPPYEGAVVLFRAAPGLTAERMQQVLDCQLARDAAIGHDSPQLARDPLAPRDVKARAFTTPNGIAAAIWSIEPRSARQVRERIGAIFGRRM
jgi:hypothetical protein